MSLDPTADRRRRRHLQSVDEVVAHALAVMAEAGAAGLSLGEVARRMGVRTPSLYVYFPSKAALYDEVFARGWRSFGEAMREFDAPPEPGVTLHEHLSAAMRRCLEWTAAHPAYSQLMFWRPIPHWEPSPDAYAAALSALTLTTEAFERLAGGGHLRPDADVSEAVDVWVTLVTGLVSQRLSNEPAVPQSSARSTALVDPLLSCFTAHYSRRSP
jgi:AcrR family transcriptional regulator